MPLALSLADLMPCFGLLALLLTGCLFPRLADRAFRTVEESFARFANKRSAAILVLILAVPFARIALLRVMPIPAPAIHDEFSYLLAADTFAHGRLTNPPSPMWQFFETIHVNQFPTYMSKYPPAQGAILAVGQLFGQPWIGVVVSMALMCGSILWMLQGWLPPRWALLGALFVFFRLAIFSYWMNSYWGGAIPAIGGALVLGALPRIVRLRQRRAAILLGFGVAILANSRPLEGLVLCLPVAAYLKVWMLRTPRPARNIVLARVCAPILLVLVPAGIFMGYYNWRLTGNPLLLPYVVNDRAHLSTPHFVWQKLAPPIPQHNPQMESFYNDWSRRFWLRSRFAVHMRVGKFVYFYLWPELCIPLIALPWLLRDRRIRFSILQFGFSFTGLLAVIWFEPHYAAPLLATLTAILVQAMRHIRLWRTGQRAYGLGITRAIVVFALAMNVLYVVRAARNPHARSLVAPAGAWGVAGNLAREQIEMDLESRPGKQLVIVRYSLPTNGEWVYNKADIDDAKVVWAREIPGTDMQPLLRYFKERSVWLVEPTMDDARITPYPSESRKE